MVYLATEWDTFRNSDDNSFDKHIPDADSKKIIQHHFKLKKKTCVENTWAMCGKRDIRCHDQREAMYYHKAGPLFILQIM